MRIALLSPLPPEGSGIAEYAANFISALESHGIEVRMPMQSNSFPPGGDTDYRPFVRRFDWRHTQLVHCELGRGGLREYQCLQALQELLPRIPVTATVHDPERLIWSPPRLPGLLDYARHLPRPVYRAVTLLTNPITLRHERRLAHHLRHIVALTHTGAHRLRTCMQLPEDRVTVIPQGNAIIAPQGLPPLDPLKLLYLGFIRHGKGLEDLIEALAQALQSQPSLRQRLRLTIAGRIAPEIPFGGGNSYLSRLKAHVVARGIVDMVSFKTDIATDAIPQLIHAHHVMVLPYREPKNLTWIGQMRGTSSALSWAAACGRGAITSDARDFPEEVAQGNGAVFAQGDVTALAGIFVQLAKRPQQVADWAAAATTVGKRREWPQIAEQFSQIFSAAIQRVR